MKSKAAITVLAFAMIVFSSFSFAQQQQEDQGERYREIIENHKSMSDFDPQDIKKFVSVQKRLNRYQESISPEYPDVDDMSDSQREEYVQRIANKTIQTTNNYGLERRTYALILNAIMTNKSFREEMAEKFDVEQ